MTTKNAKLLVIALALIASALMSACGNGVKNTANACVNGDIAFQQCAQTYNQQVAPDLNSINNALFNSGK